MCEFDLAGIRLACRGEVTHEVGVFRQGASSRLKERRNLHLGEGQERALFRDPFQDRDRAFLVFRWMARFEKALRIASTWGTKVTRRAATGKVLGGACRNVGFHSRIEGDLYPVAKPV